MAESMAVSPLNRGVHGVFGVYGILLAFLVLTFSGNFGVASPYLHDDTPQILEDNGRILINHRLKCRQS